MKLEPNHIDDIFRQRLHDAEVPPPAFVWPNVERELHRKKRRRFFLWLFAVGVAGAGLWATFAQREARPAAKAPKQVFWENKKETAPAAAVQKPSETPKTPLPQLPPLPPQQNTVFENDLTKKGDLPPAQSMGTASTRHEVRQEAVLPQNDFADIFLLENNELEPLAFSRKNNLPRAEPFIRKKKEKKTPQHCYDFEKNPNVWLLDAYFGPTFSKKTLTATDPVFNSYADMRRSTEQTAWAFNAGLRGSLLLGRHFLLRTGLHYEQMTEIFEYVDPTYVKYIVEIIQKPGEPPVIDTVGVEYGENYTKTYNRYGLLDVPLEVGGELRSGRFGLSINAGVSLNVLFWKRGDVLSADGQPTSFTPGEKGSEEVFRSSAGWSAGASGQAFFHLQPTLRVFAEPYFRKILKPVTLDDQPVEQRYQNWGIKFGVTKILD
jgi:hypothetical protein